jgi:hypothetical protein
MHFDLPGEFILHENEDRLDRLRFINSPSLPVVQPWISAGDWPRCLLS